MILRQFHGTALAHHGTAKLYDLIATRFQWPNMHRDVVDWVGACTYCQRRKKTRPTQAGLTEPITAGTPFEHVAIDVIGPFATESGEKWRILTMVDAFSRWPIAVPIRGEDTTTVADAIYQHLISKHGIPKYLASDRASGFTSAQMSAICARLGIAKRNTTGLQPQANATVERLHRWLSAALTIMCNKYSTDWNKYLDAVLFSYRIATNAATGFSPFFLVYGRHPRLPLDVILDLPDSPGFPITDKPDFVDRMEEVFTEARSCQTRMQAANKARRDALRYDMVYKQDDLVLLWEPERALTREERADYPAALPKKLQFRWSGPWIIDRPQASRHSDPKLPIHYIIRDMNGATRKPAVHVNRLAPYYPWCDDMPDSAEPNEDYTIIPDEPFKSSPGKDVVIGDTVLIPTEEDHVLPFILGKIVRLGKRDPKGFSSVNIHFYGNASRDPTKPTYPAWTAKNGKHWSYLRHPKRSFIPKLPTTLTRDSTQSRYAPSSTCQTPTSYPQT
jgi:transposase InsO family protein